MIHVCMVLNIWASLGLGGSIGCKSRSRLGLSVGNYKYFPIYNLLKSIIGVVYCGTNVITNENVAIKFEPVDAEDPQLEYKNKIYQGLTGVVGILSVC